MILLYDYCTRYDWFISHQQVNIAVKYYFIFVTALLLLSLLSNRLSSIAEVVTPRIWILYAVGDIILSSILMSQFIYPSFNQVEIAMYTTKKNLIAMQEEQTPNTGSNVPYDDKSWTTVPRCIKTLYILNKVSAQYSIMLSELSNNEYSGVKNPPH